MVVPYAVYKRHKALFGNLVSLGDVVVALREKQDADGKRTKKRFGITFDDQRQAGLAQTSLSSTPAARRQLLRR